MRNKKAFVAVIVVLILSSVVFAGGKSERNVATTVRIYQQKIEIHDALVAAAEAFNASHEGIVVEVETGGDDYVTILKGQFAAGNGATIFQSNGYNDMAVFRDYLTDLSGEDWVKYMTDIAIETASLDGTVFGFPFTTECTAIVYRNDVFKKLGLSVPKTRSEYFALCETLKNNGYPKGPMSDGFNSWYQAGMFTFSTALARQENPLAFIEGLNNGTETMIGNKKFIELATWVQEEFKYSQDPLGVDFNAQTSAFTSGRAPLVIGGSWLQPTIDDVDPNMDVGMFSYPFTEDPVENDYLYSYVGPIWHINSRAGKDEIAAAKEFINWLVYDETGNHFLTAEMKAIPGIINVTPDINAIGKLGGILYEYMRNGQTKGTYNALYPQGTGGAILFGDAVCALAAGKYSVDEFIAEAQRIWDSTK